MSAAPRVPTTFVLKYTLRTVVENKVANWQAQAQPVFYGFRLGLPDGKVILDQCP